MISLDWVTLIIENKNESPYMEDGTMSSDPFKRKIEQCLGFHFNMNKWKQNLLEHSSATLLTKDHSHQLNLQGSFFLESDYRETMEKLFIFFKVQNYKYHFTRIDVANTFKCEMKDLERDIRKIESNELKVVEYKKNKNIEYFACFNNRFSFVIYDKSLQIKQKMKKKNDYKRKFYENFKLNPLDSICRIEIRIKGGDNCSAITYSENIFEEIKKQYLLQIEKRIGLPKNIKKILINSPFNF